MNRYIIATQNRKDNEKSGTNAEDFRNFLLDLAPKIPSNSLIVLDNAKIHHATLLEDTTWKLLKTSYSIDKLYLPPYSPFLNPIEYVFNSVKKQIKFFNRPCT